MFLGDVGLGLFDLCCLDCFRRCGMLMLVVRLVSMMIVVSVKDVLGRKVMLNSSFLVVDLVVCLRLVDVVC